MPDLLKAVLPNYHTQTFLIIKFQSNPYIIIKWLSKYFSIITLISSLIKRNNKIHLKTPLPPNKSQKRKDLHQNMKFKAILHYNTIETSLEGSISNKLEKENLIRLNF